MAKSNSETQAAFRKRRLDAGETEVRGVFAKTEFHKEVKEKIRKYILKLRKSKNDL